MTRNDIYSIMITVYKRSINGKKSDWEFDSIYADGCEGGKHREKEYAQNFLDVNTKESRIEYKVEVTNE